MSQPVLEEGVPGDVPETDDGTERVPVWAVESVVAAWYAARGWTPRAACRGEDPELFFDNGAPLVRKRARRVCQGCPVRAECLQTAMEAEAPFEGEAAVTNYKRRHGTLGGLSAFERWELEFPGEAEAFRERDRARQRKRYARQRGEEEQIAS